MSKEGSNCNSLSSIFKMVTWLKKRRLDVNYDYDLEIYSDDFDGKVSKEE